ncbi:MAG: hypothetical protein CMJ40_00420 [Phycisphaerae bacterium]|nr:hypothetical protein [Phycisphaerae bacterium]
MTQLGIFRIRSLRSIGLLVVAGLLAHCTSAPQSGSPSGTSEWLEGTWTTTPAELGPIIFKADGTANIDRPRFESTVFTWKLSGKTLSMTQNGMALPDAILSNIKPNSFTGDRPPSPPVQFIRARDRAIMDVQQPQP